MSICYLRTEEKTLQRQWSSAIATEDIDRDYRLQAISQWLLDYPEVAGAPLKPASADASFRRYFRVQKGSISRIIMDAPPDREDCGPFIRIAGNLRDMGLNAPQVISFDAEQGFLMMTDLGNMQFLEVLRESPQRASELYADAIAALLGMQEQGATIQGGLPAYDRQLLTVELEIFREWLCRAHLGIEFTTDEEAQWQAICEVLIANSLEQRRVLVHRDFHSRNLMVDSSNNPGILDFQDAVEGPYTYDLVSLLKDCYIKWPKDRVDEWAMSFYDRYRAGDPDGVDSRTFRRHFDLTGVQRHLKAAGIFARLKHRDGKNGYLQDIPRTLAYVQDAAANYPELAFVSGLIGERILPSLPEVAT